MFGNLMWFIAGVIFAGIVTIKWPERWATVVSFSRRIISVADKVRVYVDRQRDVGVLILFAFTSLATASVFAQELMSRDNVDAWYGWILVWLQRPSVAAIAAGVLFAFLLPQRIKMDFPVEWSDARRKRVTRQTSFVAGFIPTLLLWPIGWDFDSMTWRSIYIVLIAGFLVATFVGAAAPFSYAIIMNQLYKRGWLNEVKWSGEARAAAKRAGFDDTQQA